MSKSIPPHIAITYQPKVAYRARPAPVFNQFPDTTKTVTLSDRIALAVCTAALPGSMPCQSPCGACRASSAAVAHKIADWLRERHGGASTTADLLDGVGTHQHAPPAGRQPIDPDQHAMALAVGRELRRPDV